MLTWFQKKKHCGRLGRDRDHEQEYENEHEHEHEPFNRRTHLLRGVDEKGSGDVRAVALVPGAHRAKDYVVAQFSGVTLGRSLTRATKTQIQIRRMSKRAREREGKDQNCNGEKQEGRRSTADR